MPTLTESPAWLALKNHQQTMAHAGIAQLFEADPQRFGNFSLHLDGLLFDYSKNLVNRDTLHLLATLARERGLGARMRELFSGGKINVTENRAVLHTALRGEQAVIVSHRCVHSRAGEEQPVDCSECGDHHQEAHAATAPDAPTRVQLFEAGGETSAAGAFDSRTPSYPKPQR